MGSRAGSEPDRRGLFDSRSPDKENPMKAKWTFLRTGT